MSQVAGIFIAFDRFLAGIAMLTTGIVRIWLSGVKIQSKTCEKRLDLFMLREPGLVACDTRPPASDTRLPTAGLKGWISISVLQTDHPFTGFSNS